MRDYAKEYLGASPQPAPRRISPERRKQLAAWSNRFYEACDKSLVLWNGYWLVKTLLKLAWDMSADGNSFRAGERRISELTGKDRKTVRAYRWQLEEAGLIKTRKVWFGKKPHFFDLEWSLLFDAAPGGISPPVPGGKNTLAPGGKIPQYLIRLRKVGKTKLIPSGGSLFTPAASPTESQGGDQAANAGQNGPNGQQEATKSGQGSSSHKAQSDASKKCPHIGSVSRETHQSLMGRMGQLFRETKAGADRWVNEGKKWSSRIKRGQAQADMVLRVIRYTKETIHSGLPIKKGVGAYVEDTWQRFTQKERQPGESVESFLEKWK